MTDGRRRRPVSPKGVRQATLDLLNALGYDPIDPAIVETPDRIARMWAELLDVPPVQVVAFTAPALDELVVLRNVTGWSICEHHLLPFSYQATVAYLPAVDGGESRIIGLSKLARLVRQHGQALQLQERMASQVADAIESATGARGVGVRIVGEHLCAVMRGVHAEGSRFVTTVVRGALRDNPATRAEFLAVAG